MNENLMRCGTDLVSSEGARKIDREASEQWGLDPFALVEAAGRSCAQEFSVNISRQGASTLRFATQRAKRYSQISGFSPRLCVFARGNEDSIKITVLAGSGNNAADALVMLKTLIFKGCVQPSQCTVLLAKQPENINTPQTKALLAVKKFGVPVMVWNDEKAAEFTQNCFIIDGIAGTGLNGPLHGTALEMAEWANSMHRKENSVTVISIDVPSGNCDGWRPDMPIINAHATLAIEPQKLCLYTPAARPHAGTIIPVGGIFHPELTAQHRLAEIVKWESAAAAIPRVPAAAHKYERGLVEIWAGSPGAAGAAKLAALGAQAAGAGLVRLIVDPSLYPVIAPVCSGVMVVPGGGEVEKDRFTPAAVLLGPGWGRSEDRRRLLETYLPLEKDGLPLVLDADAIHLAKNMNFHGNTIITPHTGEMAAFTGIAKNEILADPVPVLRRCAAEKKITILFKSHVMIVASHDGRIGVIDGMNPLLAAGGAGDVLAGFCASIAGKVTDTFSAACAAAALLIQSAQSKDIAGRFIDPAELAHAASAIAGAAWLGD